MPFEDAARGPFRELYQGCSGAPEALGQEPVGAATGLMDAFEDAKWRSLLESLPNNFYKQAVLFGSLICDEAMRLADRCGRFLSFQLGGHAGPLDGPALKAALSGAATGAGVSSRSTDLVIISDLLCTESDRELERLAALTARALPTGGHCALLHWADGSLCGASGEAGAERFVRIANSRLQPLLRRRTPDFRLDILERV